MAISPKLTSRTHQLPALQMRAEFVPSTFNSEKRTVDLTWTTGARVLRGGGWFDDPFHEELSLDPAHVRMGRLQSGSAPLLDSHRSYGIDSVIGVVESARLDAGAKSGSATVRFDTGDRGEDALRKVRDGILRNVSVGYRVHKMQQVESARERDDKTAVFRAVDWEPYEISMVPMGADAGAGTRAESATNPCEFTLQERAMPEPIPTPTTTAPVTAPVAPVVADADVQRAAAGAERDRVLGIQRVARALGRPAAEADKAIADGVDLAKFRELAIDARAKSIEDGGQHTEAGGGQGGIRVTGGTVNAEKWARAIEASIILRCGSEATDALKRNAEKGGEKVELDAGEFRGMRMLDVARACLERAGISIRGKSALEILGLALTAGRGADTDSMFTNRAPAQTTGDFPLILENVLHKLLLAQYGITPDTWRRVCTIGSAVDFRPNPRYRLGSIAVLDSLNELGEFKNKSFPDAEKQTIALTTKGNMLALSRQALLNDDMSAFSRIAMAFGRAAALSIESDFYASLASNGGAGPNLYDGNPMFYASRNNISTGAAIGSNAIDLDRVAMASQKDPSGNEILSLVPAVIVLPLALGGTMRQINNGEYDFDALSSKNPWVPNKVRNVVRDIVDTPRLTGTKRYLFADPAIAPCFEVIFLDGQQQPYMEMQQGWRLDGVEWKIRLDYAVGGIDFRGGVMNAGA